MFNRVGPVLMALALTAIPLVASADTMTFTVADAADDGAATSADIGTYPPIEEVFSTTGDFGDFGAVVPAIRFYDDNADEYRIAVGLMRWNTSALPDNATVESASLRCTTTATSPPPLDGGIFDQEGRSLTADWYTAWPIDAADYSVAAETSALAGVLLSDLTPGALNTIPLDNTNGVSTTGYTGLRLHISGGVPAGFSIVLCAAFEHDTFDPPELVVTYSLPPDPSPDPSPSPSTVGGALPPGGGNFRVADPSHPFIAVPSAPTLPSPPASTAVAPLPVRNLDLERSAIRTFVNLFARLPLAPADWRAIHHHAYGQRIQRNIEAERSALTRFVRLFGRLPTSDGDWRIIHVLGYLAR